jgi:hypothetical protein
MPRRDRTHHLLAVVALVAVVVVSGCVGGGSLPFVDSSPDATTTTPSTEARPTAPSTGTPVTPTATARTSTSGVSGETANRSTRLWPDEPIVVAIDDAAGTDRDWRPLVGEALAFWEGNATKYAGYPVEFVLWPDATDPDVEIRVVGEIEDCVGSNDAIGCAPYFTARNQIRRPVNVSVVTGLDDESTVRVLEHELGHVLGLDHGQAPQRIMARSALVNTIPKPNATERALPWQNASLAVYVDDTTDSDQVREEVRNGLEYFDRGADGTVPENVTFAFVDDPESADVVISFPSTSPCGAGRGSCGRRIGPDTDGDGALEYYTRLEIAVTDVDPTTIDWHVAYWLGYGFGFDAESDWPAPLRDATPEERRGDWWANETARAAPTLLAIGS